VVGERMKKFLGLIDTLTPSPQSYENWKKIADIIGKYSEKPDDTDTWSTASVKILDALIKMEAVVEAAKKSRWSCEDIDLMDALEELEKK
jgi:transcriptional regulator of heat shock response